MLNNPFLPAPSAASAWSEGFVKGLMSSSSPAPSETIGAEDIEAFNQGVAAGEEATQSGVDLGDPCIAALEEHGPAHVPLLAFDAVDVGHGVWEAVHLGKIGIGIASFVVVLIELACTLPVHVRPAEDVLPSLIGPMVNALRSSGLDSMELFCGAGLDASATDCEVRMTPLFLAADQARQAAIDMNRPNWIVASWRTDQSNGFRIVDES